MSAALLLLLHLLLLLRLFLLLLLLLLLLVLLLRLLLRTPSRELLLAVFPARAEPRASAGSVPSRTSPASFGWQFALPDLSRKPRPAVFPAAPQPRTSAGSVFQPRVRRYACNMPDRMSESMLQDMPKRTPGKGQVWQTECQNECQRICQN